MKDPVSHYRILSKEYYRKNNKYCEEVYTKLADRIFEAMPFNFGWFQLVVCEKQWFVQ